MDPTENASNLPAAAAAVDAPNQVVSVDASTRSTASPPFPPLAPPGTAPTFIPCPFNWLQCALEAPEALGRLGTTRPLNDGNWRRDRSRMQRQAYLLQNELYTDTTFSVKQGTEPAQLIHCHKIMLAVASPVFEAMLFGPLAEAGVIRVDDIVPDIFRKMLLFIYSEQFADMCMEEAIALCLVADKYLLDDLKTRCMRHMHSKLAPSNAVAAYEFAREFECSPLREEAMKVLAFRTEEVIKYEGILEADISTLKDLLDQDELKLESEKVLWETVLNWGRCECLRKGVSLEGGGGALRRVVQPLLPAIRFLTMKPQEFAEGPAAGDVLSHEESKALLMHLASTRAPTPLPAGFCPSRRRRCFVCVFYNLAELEKSGSLGLWFSVRRAVDLVGVLVADQCFAHAPHAHSSAHAPNGGGGGHAHEVALRFQQVEPPQARGLEQCVTCKVPLSLTPSGGKIAKFPVPVRVQEGYRYRIVIQETRSDAVYTLCKKPTFVAQRHDLSDSKYFRAILCV